MKIQHVLVSILSLSFSASTFATSFYGDDKYEIVAGVFSRNEKLSKNFAKNLGISPDRCYSNYVEMTLP